ncbi:adenine phosphoribosyltransferase [bacterium]|nr:adenine phosphoribosyltransferase [bacterium]
MDLRACVRDVVDFPKKGIVFKDITPLLADPKAFAYVTDHLAERYANQEFDKIIAVESRGFFFGAGLSLRLGRGLVPVRKPGKLPAEKIRQTFDLEYGQDALEIHTDAIKPGEKVLIVDDLLATGGTLEASTKLVEALGGEVLEIVTIIELTFLKGRERLAGYPLYACIQY